MSMMFRFTPPPLLLLHARRRAKAIVLARSSSSIAHASAAAVGDGVGTEAVDILTLARSQIGRLVKERKLATALEWVETKIDLAVDRWMWSVETDPCDGLTRIITSNSACNRSFACCAFERDVPILPPSFCIARQHT
jgi:hypothetical protein